MKCTFKPAQRINTKQPASMHAFALMNNQFLSNQEINQVKPYLTSVAHQNRYATAAIRAQLALGWMYAQKSCATRSPITKSFYTLKAKEYLANIALQENYKKGQECALMLLRILAVS